MEQPKQFYVDRAAGILHHIQYATLATVTPDGWPWNSPVRMVYDAELNFYWFSDKAGRHSQNVRSNGRVFIVVYDSTVPEGQGAGVYFESEAQEATDRTVVSRARRLKKGEASDDAAEFLGNAVRRVYQAKPVRAWTNETELQGGRFVRDYRIELPLDDLRRAVVLGKN